MSSALSSAGPVTLKVISANSVDPDQTAQEQSDLGPHCLPECKNRFEKFARIFSRRYKQTTFSDAGFLGALRVKSFLVYAVACSMQCKRLSVSFMVSSRFRVEHTDIESI